MPQRSDKLKSELKNVFCSTQFFHGYVQTRMEWSLSRKLLDFSLTQPNDKNNIAKKTMFYR